MNEAIYKIADAISDLQYSVDSLSGIEHQLELIVEKLDILSRPIGERETYREVYTNYRTMNNYRELVNYYKEIIAKYNGQPEDDEYKELSERLKQYETKVKKYEDLL